MNFDPTIHYGDIIVSLTVAIGGVSFFFQFKSSISELGRRVTSAEAQLKKLEDVVLSNARIEERVIAMGLRVTALEAVGRT